MHNSLHNSLQLEMVYPTRKTIFKPRQSRKNLNGKICGHKADEFAVDIKHLSFHLRNFGRMPKKLELNSYENFV